MSFSVLILILLISLMMELNMDKATVITDVFPEYDMQESNVTSKLKCQYSNQKLVDTDINITLVTTQ